MNGVMILLILEDSDADHYSFVAGYLKYRDSYQGRERVQAVIIPFKVPSVDQPRGHFGVQAQGRF